MEIKQFTNNDTFYIVCARTRHNVKEKILELEQMPVPFLIVCGEQVDHPRVIYRSAMGKWDAINFASTYIPKNTSIIILNDVDTKIFNPQSALECFGSDVDLVYCQVKVSIGPQAKFYRLLDPIRQAVHVCASGEYMLIKKSVFQSVVPIPPCMAEDSYILFKALELGYHAYFCTKTYVTTKRTLTCKAEEEYKARTTLGIYQALKYTKPSPLVRLFYLILPLASPLLLLAGDDGNAWAKGIRKAVKDRMMKNQATKF